MQILESNIVHELIPCKGNPRNSEGAFLKLKDGRILFAYSRYHGESAGDHEPCDICAIESTDGGESFSASFRTLVSASDYGEKNVMEASLLRLNNGDLGLIFLLKHPGITSEVILKRSNDEGLHFDAGVRIAPERIPAYLVINNDRCIRLSDGRWILPVARHASSIHQNENGEEYFDERGEIRFYISSDDGKNWQESRAALHLPNLSYSNTGLQEPGIVELPNGVLYAYFRTDLSCHYESVSIDGGKHFFTPQPSRFTAPASPLLIKKNPYSQKYYAIWNPVPEYFGRKLPKNVWTGGRNPLVIAESEDGYNFSEPVILENDENRGFCYPALYALDAKNLLLAYCSGGETDGSCLSRITMRKIMVES